MQTKSFPQQIECTAHGPVQIRFALIVETDDGNEISRNWHRTVIAPDSDLSTTLAANNASIVAQGFPPVDENDEDWQRLIAICNTAWTPAVRNVYTIAKTAALAKFVAEQQAQLEAQAEAEAAAKAIP